MTFVSWSFAALFVVHLLLSFGQRVCVRKGKVLSRSWRPPRGTRVAAAEGNLAACVLLLVDLVDHVQRGAFPRLEPQPVLVDLEFLPQHKQACAVCMTYDEVCIVHTSFELSAAFVSALASASRVNLPTPTGLEGGAVGARWRAILSRGLHSQAHASGKGPTRPAGRDQVREGCMFHVRTLKVGSEFGGGWFPLTNRPKNASKNVRSLSRNLRTNPDDYIQTVW